MDQPRIVLSQSAPIAQYFPEADHTSSSPGIAYNDAEAFFFLDTFLRPDNLQDRKILVAWDRT